MQGKSSVIKGLNRVLRNELVAISQYFLHSRMYGQWGYGKLAERTRAQSLGEMRHADRLLERILFLGGTPEMSDAVPVQVGKEPRAMLQSDLKLEQEALPVLRKVVTDCEQQEDYVSRELSSSILADEESHLDWLETQIGLITSLGLKNYLQSQT